MTDLHISVRYCETCGAMLEIRATRPNMCGSPMNHWELYWVCPVFGCYVPNSWIHIKVE